MEELLTYGQKERYHRIAVFGGTDYVICYTYCGDEFGLDLGAFSGESFQVAWMDPQSGAYSPAGTVEAGTKAVFRPLRREYGANDWVLVLRRGAI